MNKFKEFDNMKIPDNWKEDLLRKEKINQVSLQKYRVIVYVIVLIIAITSIGFVYAYNEDFKL